MGCSEKIVRGALRNTDTIQFQWTKIVAIITLLASALPASEKKTLGVDFNSDGKRDTLKTCCDGGTVLVSRYLH